MGSSLGVLALLLCFAHSIFALLSHAARPRQPPHDWSIHTRPSLRLDPHDPSQPPAPPRTPTLGAPPGYFEIQVEEASVPPRLTHSHGRTRERGRASQAFTGLRCVHLGCLSALFCPGTFLGWISLQQRRGPADRSNMSFSSSLFFSWNYIAAERSEMIAVQASFFLSCLCVCVASFSWVVLALLSSKCALFRARATTGRRGGGRLTCVVVVDRSRERVDADTRARAANGVCALTLACHCLLPHLLHGLQTHAHSLLPPLATKAKVTKNSAFFAKRHVGLARRSWWQAIAAPSRED